LKLNKNNETLKRKMLKMNVNSNTTDLTIKKKDFSGR
jgi:hypothetical protein